MSQTDPVVSYFNGDELSADAWKNKYKADGETTPDDMHKRLANEFFRIEKKYIKREKLLWFKRKKLSEYGQSRSNLTFDKIYNYFKNFKYIIPQGSIMYGLGRKDKYISLSNCFVIDSALDSYTGVMKTDQEQVQLMKRRAGVGHDISNLRPNTTEVSNSAGTSTGAASFMERFSNSTREVAQGGRRGALMLSIDINHPDVEEFATIKSDLTKVTGANVSIKINHDFMLAVKHDEEYLLRWPCTTDLRGLNKDDFELDKLTKTNVYINEKLQEVYIKKINASKLWDVIITQARNTAEPGIMFWDNVIQKSPDGGYDEFRPVSSNPCGEQFLQPYDSCRLMALNLYSIVKNPFTDNSFIDYKKLYEIAYEQQRLMDDLVDLEIEYVNKIIDKILSDPEPMSIKTVELELWEKVKFNAERGRRTGSGITALADMLAAVNVKYDSEQGLYIAKEVMETKMKAELDASIDLAILRGKFLGYNKKYESNAFYYNLSKNSPDQYKRMRKYGRRNISWSTIAPTGTVSLMSQVSSGCEPLFMPFYTRRRKVNPSDKTIRVDFVDQNGDSWQEYPVLHEKFKLWLIETLKDQVSFSEHYISNNITKEELQKYFERSPWYKATANDIDWRMRVRMQSVLQKYTTNAISSTLNLPKETTVDTVKQIYTSSYWEGLKGVTCYVDGSRTGVLVSENDNEKDGDFNYLNAAKRPETLPCDINHLTAKGNKWTIVVGLYKNKPYEIFALQGTIFKKYKKGNLVKQGNGQYLLTVGETEENIQFHNNIVENMSDEEKAITRLLSIALRHKVDPTYIVEQLNKSDGTIVSFTKALSRTLSKYVNEEELISKSKCLDCGSTNLVMSEGCVKCLDCGSSKCG